MDASSCPAAVEASRATGAATSGEEGTCSGGTAAVGASRASAVDFCCKAGSCPCRRKGGCGQPQGGCGLAQGRASHTSHALRLCVRGCLCAGVRVRVRLRVCLRVRVRVCVCACVSVFLSVVYVCLYVCLFTCLRWAVEPGARRPRRGCPRRACSRRRRGVAPVEPQQ